MTDTQTQGIDPDTPPRRSQPAEATRKPHRWRTGELIDNRWFVHHALPPSNMGQVYFCFDTALSRNTVAKSLPPGQLADVAAQERFRRECETWIRLGTHANIAQAYFVESVNTYPYVFAEWVQGRGPFNAGLDHWAGSTDLPMELIVKVIADVCEGLQYSAKVLAAEGAVFVHRDIKPANILLSHVGIAKVTDFGIAKQRLIANRIAEATTAAADFEEGSNFLGTPAYMSPEHFTSPSSIDARSDIYSIGCTMYLMTTGQPVFRAKSWAEWQESHESQIPSRMTTLRPDIPPHIDDLVVDCLAKEPSERPQTFAEIVERLYRPGGRRTTLLKAAIADSGTTELDEPLRLANLATSIDSLGKPEEALVQLRRALRSLESKTIAERLPTEFNITYNMAVAYDHAGDFRGSMLMWNKAILLANSIRKRQHVLMSSQANPKLSALLGKALTLTLSIHGDL